MVNAQTKIGPWEWDAQNSLGFWDINRSPNLGQTIRPSNSKKKWTCRTGGFAIPPDHRVKSKEREKQDKYLDLTREVKTMVHEGDIDTNSNRRTRDNLQRIGQGTGRLKNQRTSGDHPNYSIIKISQNTEKSPGDFRRLVVNQTPVKKHQITLAWKTLKGVIILSLNYVQKKFTCVTNLLNHKKRFITLCKWRISRYLQKLEKNRRTWPKQ